MKYFDKKGSELFFFANVLYIYIPGLRMLDIDSKSVNFNLVFFLSVLQLSTINNIDQLMTNINDNVGYMDRSLYKITYIYIIIKLDCCHSEFHTRQTVV